MGTVLRGASVVDGTGTPARRDDVRVEDGRITDVGPSLAAVGDEVLDLDGLVLAPGFIDPHTHYDAQVTWDADLTPSSWHGVTTVVMGNCGFGIAPMRPANRELMLRTLENVEGMSLAALQEGVRWEYESFSEYLDLVDELQPRCNVAAFVGHTPVRLHVMGDEAIERAATEDEIDAMAEIVHDAVRAGAVGLSTSDSPHHVGAHGRPVASRLATEDEFRRLVGAVGRAGSGIVQGTLGPTLTPALYLEMARATGRPATWSSIMTKADDPAYAHGFLEDQDGFGVEVHPQMACKPIIVQISMESPFPLANVPAIAEILELAPADRAARYREDAWRERARREIPEHWGTKIASAVVQESRRHAHLVDGPTMAALAAEQRADATDVMIDLALAEDLQTRFQIEIINDHTDQVGELLTDTRLLLSLSDAGAHTSQLCDANYATHLLGTWWRQRQAIGLETAVWRLTGHPASVMGLADRGVVRPGAVADLVAFDPDSVGTGPLERVRDFPGGADRLIARSSGIEHVLVAGRAIRSDGRDTDDRPGRVLRNGVPTSSKGPA